MNYKEFIKQVIKVDATIQQRFPQAKMLSNDDLSFAYISYTNFDISVSEAIEMAFEFQDQKHVSENQRKEFLNIQY